MVDALPPGVQPGGRFGQWRGPVAPSYVVCDVDGTLVGPEALASAQVASAVARIQAAGIRFGLATGRMRDAVAGLAAQLRPTGPDVLHNGAEVRADGRTIARWTLRDVEVDGLLRIAADHNAGYVEIYPESGYVVSNRDPRALPHWQVLGGPPRSTLVCAADLGGASVLKATFPVFDPARTPALVAAVHELGLLAGPAGSPRTPGLGYVNATHPDADKGRAVRSAAGHLGITLDAVVAVGDADNDLSMLAVAGTAIAMGQATEAVRDAAHLVVPEVASHGLSTALDALLGWSAVPQRR